MMFFSKAFSIFGIINFHDQNQPLAMFHLLDEAIHQRRSIAKTNLTVR